MTSVRIADRVGLVLNGRYRLLAPIGTGASAHVYLADDVTLKRRVAVKLLHSALAEDESFLRRFQAEAQSAAALNHPNIMRVYDWGQSDDGPYLVLEYLEGGSLRDMLDGVGRLSLEQTAQIGLEAARALDYAHRRGLIHRDIKPANLLFDDEARLCIADFGLARALAEAAWTEPTGAIMGTARYASPEQVRGASVDGKADVYSLALVLTESVTGAVPFSADTTIATLMGRIEQPLTGSDVLGPLAAVITGAGALEPTERFDASAVAQGLSEAAKELPNPAKLPLTGTRTPDATILIPPDQTMLGLARPKVPDFAVENAAEDEIVILPDDKRHWLRNRYVWAALLALVVAAAAAAIFFFTPILKPSHAVPDIRGLSVSAARQEVSDEKFDIQITRREYDEQAPVNQILEQDPVSGNLKEGEDIDVVVSKGPSPRLVPELAGKTEAEATQELTANQFAVKVNRVFNETVPKGVVLDWSPKGRRPRGQEIALTVSDGPTPQPLANVVGKSADQATAILAAQGLTASRREVFNDTVPAGIVISTEPAAGQGIQRGSSVVVNVSKGPELVTVPNVRGQSVDSATARLEAAGFQVVNVFGPPKRQVFETDPPIGSRAKRGSSVALYTR